MDGPRRRRCLAKAGLSIISVNVGTWRQPWVSPDHERSAYCQGPLGDTLPNDLRPAIRIGQELIAAGMLILAGGGRGLPLDYDELERWTRVGFERGTRSRNGER